MTFSLLVAVSIALRLLGWNPFHHPPSAQLLAELDRRDSAFVAKARTFSLNDSLKVNKKSFQTDEKSLVSERVSQEISSRVSINTSSEQVLSTLPGIGSVTAKRIVDYRNTHGPFRELANLKKVKGIGSRKYARIKHLIRL